VHFFAPLDEENPDEEIAYDYSDYPSDYELLKANDDHHDHRYVMK